MSTELTQLELQVAENRVQITATAMAIPDELSFEAWADIGKKLCRTSRMMQWWVGDWGAYGERRFPGKLKEFAELNNINYAKLRDMSSVSESVQLPLRKEGLDWAYYSEVRALPKKEQTLWLELADREKLTIADLRQKIRISQGETASEDKDAPVGVNALKWLDDLTHWLKTRPSEFWTDERKAVWRKELDALVRIYHSIGS